MSIARGCDANALTGFATLDEVAEVCGVTRRRAMQLEQAAIRKLWRMTIPRNARLFRTRNLNLAKIMTTKELNGHLSHPV